jgi:Ni/Fe-hydrogenase 1 B-type cytochrome subunit
MQQADLKRTLVWGGWYRFSHACIGLASIVLLVTGWIIANDSLLAADALDIHYLSASFLVLGLAIRGVLLFAGREHERFSALIPLPREIAAIRGMAIFYLSLGKMPMPRWYAHNPLWKLIYLVILLALVIQIISGGLMQDSPVIWGMYLPGVHNFWAGLIFWFAILHVIAVIFHDLKGNTSDLSGIVNGYRLFQIERSEFSGDAPEVQTFSIDQLKKPRS